MAVALAAGLLLLSGCGQDVHNERAIQTDLEQNEELLTYLDGMIGSVDYYQFFSYNDMPAQEEAAGYLSTEHTPVEQFALDQWNIESVEIEKRQTNKEAKTDVVYADVELTNKFVSQKLSTQLNYNFYDEGGWILDELLVEDATMTALSGVHQDNVLYDIPKAWLLPDSAVEISDNTFDRDNQTDVFQVNYIPQEGGLLSASGTATLTYIFDWNNDAGMYQWNLQQADDANVTVSYNLCGAWSGEFREVYGYLFDEEPDVRVQVAVSISQMNEDNTFTGDVTFSRTDPAAIYVSGPITGQIDPYTSEVTWHFTDNRQTVSYWELTADFAGALTSTSTMSGTLTGTVINEFCANGKADIQFSLPVTETEAKDGE